mgnify:CR=1 FL=1
MSLQSISPFITTSPIPSSLVTLPTEPSLNQFSVETNNHSYSQFKFHQIIKNIENPPEYQTTLGKVVGGAIDGTVSYITRAWQYLFPSEQIKEQHPEQENFERSNQNLLKQVEDDSDGCTWENSGFAWNDIESFNCTRTDGSSYSQWYEPVVDIWGNCTYFYSLINNPPLAKKAMYHCLDNMVKIYYQNVHQSTEAQGCILIPHPQSSVTCAFGSQASFTLAYGDNYSKFPTYLFINQSQIPLPPEVNECYTQNTYQNDSTGTTYIINRKNMEGVSLLSYNTPYCTYQSMEQSWELTCPSVDFFKYTDGQNCFSKRYLECMGNLITSYYDNSVSPACGAINPNITQITIPLQGDSQFNIYSPSGFPVYQLEARFPVVQAEECYVNIAEECFQRRDTTEVTLTFIGVTSFLICSTGSICLYRFRRQIRNNERIV